MNRVTLPERLPAPPGRCAHCGVALLEPREASIEKIRARYRLTCRDIAACWQRRKEKEK
jgi:hypothetical protein